MVKKYVFVRMDKVDFDKIIKEKKIPMEQDLRGLMGKPIKIKNIQLFKICANCTWELGGDIENKLFRGIRIKKGDVKI